MCGRFTLRTPPAELAEIFELTRVPDAPARYNVAPTQPVVVIHDPLGESGRPWDWMRWGLVPSWSKDPRTGAKLINARMETVATRPAFRAAFKRRRCLIPADGFYEWRRTKAGKFPFWIHLADQRPFAFAGLWEHWSDGGGGELHSCCIITTLANEAVASVHDRMPAILPREQYELWLDPDVGEPLRLQSLLEPYPAEEMVLTPVGTYVNNARHEGPQCLDPAAG